MHIEYSCSFALFSEFDTLLLMTRVSAVYLLSVSQGAVTVPNTSLMADGAGHL